MRKIVIAFVISLVAVVVFGGGQALALSLGFYSITNNNPTNAAIGSQLAVEVIDFGPNQVLFTFRNNVGAASSITDVYFDDGTLLGIASIQSSAGVAFSQYASPSNLPGGSSITPVFLTTAGFSADSTAPVSKNGVNAASEWLNVYFNLQSGGTFADVLDELGTGELRIGIHVQAFSNGGSESFINNSPSNGPAPIPEPASILLLGTGLLGLAKFGRKKYKK